MTDCAAAPVDASTVRADDELIENLRNGGPAQTSDRIAEMLAAFRDEARR